MFENLLLSHCEERSDVAILSFISDSLDFSLRSK
jgi:hypothetical protein